MQVLTRPGLFCDSLQATGDARFFFTQGTTPAKPPPEYAGFFGPPPNYTFATTDGPVRFNMRDFPKRDSRGHDQVRAGQGGLPDLLQHPLGGRSIDQDPGR